MLTLTKLRPGLLDLTHWTPVGLRSRFSRSVDPWFDVGGAPLTLKQARALYDSGQVLKACRFTEDEIYYVIKRFKGDDSQLIDPA